MPDFSQLTGDGVIGGGITFGSPILRDVQREVDEQFLDKANVVLTASVDVVDLSTDHLAKKAYDIYNRDNLAPMWCALDHKDRLPWYDIVQMVITDNKMMEALRTLHS